MKRWVVLLALVSSCAPAMRSRSPAALAERREILAAAADSLLATIGDTLLFTADVATAEALGPAARRLARSVAPSPGEVWCQERTTAAGRVVGVTVALALDSVIGERAEARWSATCLMNVPGAKTPAAFGGIGVYEVIRRDGRWGVTRSVLRMEL